MLRLGANFASVGSCLAGSAEWLIWDFSLFRNSCLVHPVRVNRESKKKTWPVKPKQTPKWGRATVSDIDSLRVPHFEQHLPRDTRYFLQKNKYWRHTENLSPVFGFKTQIRSFFFFRISWIVLCSMLMSLFTPKYIKTQTCDALKVS